MRPKGIIMQRVLPCLLIAFLLSACASKPVLYPNSTYKKRGKERAQKDIDHCMKEAEQFLESKKGKKILRQGGKGSLLGGAIGAVSGIFSGDVASGALQGAAIGGTAGAGSAALSPDELKRAYVNRCLQKKGYNIMGWD